MTNTANNYRAGNLKLLLLKFSAPAVTGIIVNAAYNIIDRVLIGHSVGADGIAGITVLFPVGIFFMAIGLWVGVGASVLFGINLGKKNYENAERILGNAFLLLIASAVILTALAYIFMDPLLRMLGAQGAIYPYARAFAEISFIGAVFQTTAMGLNAFIRAMGRPTLAMMTLLIGAVLNAVLGVIFIFGMGMGIRGSALATVIAQAVTFIWTIHCFTGKNKEIKIKLPNLALKANIIKKSLTLGSAMFILQISFSIVMAVLNKSLIKYGSSLAVSAMGITASANMIFGMPVLGISQGMQPIISYNMGRRKYKIIYQILKLALIWSTVILAACWAIVNIFTRHIVYLFNATDTALIDLTVHTMRVFNLSLPLIGVIILTTGFFQAAGKPKQAIFMALSRQILFLLPLLFVMPRFFGFDGVIYAGPVSDGIVFVIATVMLIVNIKRMLFKKR